MLDLLIIGGSAAATTAGIYAARRKLNFKVIAKDFGGEVATSGEVGNWPGIEKIDGFELAQQFKNHLKSYGIEPELGVWVEKIKKNEDGTFCISAKKEGETSKLGEKMPEHDTGAPTCDYEAKAVIIATGAHPKMLNIPGEKEFKGKGITYCTTCDGPLFGDKVTVTIGGGNAALESTIMMAGISKKHYILTIDPQFTGDKILADKISQMGNVEMIFNAETLEILGNGFVTGLRYKDRSTGEEKRLDVEGVLIHIGVVPNSNLAPEGTEKNNFGEIVINTKSETNVPGLYAAGDVTNIPFKQIVIATGQGATAVLSVIEYINRLEK